MRILHVIPAYYPATSWGGPIFSSYELNNALASIPDIELQILTTDSAGPLLSQQLDSSKLDVKKLYPNQVVHFAHRIFRNSISPELIQKIPELVNWADVVHLTASYSFPTIPTLISCRLMGKPVVWSPRGGLQKAVLLGSGKNKNQKLIWDFVCNALLISGKSILHTTSNEEKGYSIARLPDARAVVIRNGMTTPHTMPERVYMPKGELRLIFMGRIDPIKGLENLLDALFDLRDLKISLSIYGSGNNEYISQLQGRMRKLGHPDGLVYFRGQVSGESKVNAFMNADILVLPSLSENFGMVIAEALAYGVPVITSRNTPWQRVEEKRCGLWVENTPQSLAKAIRDAKEMDLVEMGKNGWNWMNDDFDWHGIAEQMVQVYESLSG